MSRQPYIPPLRRYTWWLSRPRYIRYMLREFSAAFIGAYVLMLVTGLLRLSQGREAYESWLAAVSSPAGIVFGLAVFGFAVYHSVTWFSVTPKAMPFRFRGKAVPPAVIVGVHWFGWAIASFLILFWTGR